MERSWEFQTLRVALTSAGVRQVVPLQGFRADTPMVRGRCGGRLGPERKEGGPGEDL